MADWLLIDGSSLAFRSFYGVPLSVKAPDGSPANAVRGFMDALARVIRERRPGRLAVAQDADWRPAWRVRLIGSYKAHRVAEPMPPALAPQMERIDQLLDAVGVDRAGVSDFEAEDVIATWVRLAGPSASIEILSGDRDLFALVEGRRVVVLYPERAGVTMVDAAHLERRYGVPDGFYSDFAILRGDPSDGLPGLAGIGPARAAELVRRHGGVANLVATGALSPEDRDYLERAVQVVVPREDLALSLPEGRRPSYPADVQLTSRLAALSAAEDAVGRLVQALDTLRIRP